MQGTAPHYCTLPRTAPRRALGRALHGSRSMSGSTVHHGTVFLHYMMLHAMLPCIPDTRPITRHARCVTSHTTPHYAPYCPLLASPRGCTFTRAEPLFGQTAAHPGPLRAWGGRTTLVPTSDHQGGLALTESISRRRLGPQRHRLSVLTVDTLKLSQPLPTPWFCTHT